MFDTRHKTGETDLETIALSGYVPYHNLEMPLPKVSVRACRLDHVISGPSSGLADIPLSTRLTTRAVVQIPASHSGYTNLDKEKVI